MLRFARGVGLVCCVSSFSLCKCGELLHGEVRDFLFADYGADSSFALVDIILVVLRWIGNRGGFNSSECNLDV